MSSPNAVTPTVEQLAQMTVNQNTPVTPLAKMSPPPPKPKNQNKRDREYPTPKKLEKEFDESSDEEEEVVRRRKKQKRTKMILSDTDDDDNSSDEGTTVADDDELRDHESKIEKYHKELKEEADACNVELVEDDEGGLVLPMEVTTNNEIESTENEMEQLAASEQQDIKELMFSLLQPTHNSKALDWVIGKANHSYQHTLSEKVLRKCSKKAFKRGGLNSDFKSKCKIRCTGSDFDKRTDKFVMTFKVILTAKTKKELHKAVVKYARSLIIELHLDVFNGCMYQCYVKTIKTPPKETRVNIFDLMKKVKTEEDAKTLAEFLKKSEGL